MKNIISDIVVIDSGVSDEIKKEANIVGGCSITMSNGSVCFNSDFTDNLGHGTAVTNCILKNASDANFFIIKIFQDNLECDEDILIEALKYILSNISCKIINISSGVVNIVNKKVLYKLCFDLCKYDVVIVSASDNEGAVTYPAAFDCVIGVDTSNKCHRYADYIYIENSIINILARGGRQRAHWNNKDIIIFGTSFATANMTSNIFKILHRKHYSFDKVLYQLKEDAIFITTYDKQKVIKPAEIHHAIVFPYNKEVHSILNFSDLLSFDLVDIYDLRLSGNVTKTVNSLYNCDVHYTIKSFDNLDWGQNKFDTIIVGHIDELEIISKRDISKEIIEKSKIFNKNIYCFDIELYQKAINSGCNVYCPQIKDISIVNSNCNKLNYINSPVLGIFGTSSRQGKFTLQLLLRKYFLSCGYIVGQLGTEPSSLLFGFDELFPMGYRSSVETKGYKSVLCLNQMMERINDKDPEVIIVGSQSGSSLYWRGNLAQYPIPQIEFLLGTLPDAVILCVNPYDDIEYIERTIKTIEGLADSNVIALVVYPMTFADDWHMIMNKKSALTDLELKQTQRLLEEKLKIKAYVLGKNEEINELFNQCIDYFNNS